MCIVEIIKNITGCPIWEAWDLHQAGFLVFFLACTEKNDEGRKSKHKIISITKSASIIPL
jgi:hypothetical protein